MPTAALGARGGGAESRSGAADQWASGSAPGHPPPRAVEGVGAGAGGAWAYLGVAVQAVHVELRGPGHHEVALAVVEEVAVHGELEPGGRVRLLVHGVHGAEPGLHGAEDDKVSGSRRTAAYLAVGAHSLGTGTTVNTVRQGPETECEGSGPVRLRSGASVELLGGGRGGATAAPGGRG